MRVVMVISSLGSGGAERVMSEMASYWAAKDWDILILTFSGREVADFYPLDSRVKRSHLDMRKSTTSVLEKLSFNILRLLRLRKFLKSKSPDAVLSFMDSTNVLTIIAGMGLRSRVIVSERNDPVANVATTPFWRWARKYCYRRADRVVAQTEAVGQWLVGECGANVAVIPNPLRSMPEPGAERGQQVLAVGSLSWQKGFDVLLAAFAGLSKQFPDWSLVILGEGAERRALEAQRTALGLDEKVHMPGRVVEVEHWMARASLMVQPSRFEGFPNVLLEGMGMGLPVISSDCRSGPAEIIQHGVNGVLVPVNDADALSMAMTELMSSPKRRESLGRSAMTVREIYSPSRIMPQWEAVIQGRAPDGDVQVGASKRMGKRY